MCGVISGQFWHQRILSHSEQFQNKTYGFEHFQRRGHTREHTGCAILFVFLRGYTQRYLENHGASRLSDPFLPNTRVLQSPRICIFSEQTRLGFVLTTVTALLFAPEIGENVHRPQYRKLFFVLFVVFKIHTNFQVIWSLPTVGAPP